MAIGTVDRTPECSLPICSTLHRPRMRSSGFGALTLRRSGPSPWVIGHWFCSRPLLGGRNFFSETTPLFSENFRKPPIIFGKQSKNTPLFRKTFGKFHLVSEKIRKSSGFFSRIIKFFRISFLSFGKQTTLSENGSRG